MNGCWLVWKARVDLSAIAVNGRHGELDAVWAIVECVAVLVTVGKDERRNQNTSGFVGQPSPTATCIHVPSYCKV